MSSSKRNIYTFGLGTIGRDMVYSLISMYLIFYLSDVRNLSNRELGWITAIVLAARIFDAFNDPVMGVIVDNTRSRWGKFKPWIAIGALMSAVFTVLLFVNYPFSGSSYVLLFALLYLSWGIAFTANDISFWSMLPSLTVDQRQREKIGAFARICANIGLFSVVAGIVPATGAIAAITGDMEQAYLVFALIVVAVLIGGQLITLFGVHEPREMFQAQEKTTVKGMFAALFGNDQLRWTAISMALFMVGYVTTTSFGLYFFKYAYGDESMYSIFALVLGVSQIAALVFFPLISRKFSRGIMYRGATVLVLAGYVIFFFSPMDMRFISLAGILLFVGQAAIQLLMLMFLADTVEYGQWKLGRRNESVTFALQPFINKMGGAVANGVVGFVIIISGINDASSASDVSAEGLFIMKAAMMILPLICIIIGFLIYRSKFIIDEAFHQKIVGELESQGEIRRD